MGDVRDLGATTINVKTSTAGPLALMGVLVPIRDPKGAL
jgi:hypothetical protein